MDYFYIIIVALLFIFAISDLVVGVGNDAVNFLNSAVGSKAAPLKIILSVAAVGVLLGATFSNGMMEVARKGIFHPQSFFFAEIMVIFLAVMLTDLLLLDTFNTFGLPTSTTVSIVFELLGAAVAIAIVKIYQTGDTFANLSNYINSANALAIVSGILISIVVAFTCGAIFQYFSRLLFSFNYHKNFKFFGAVWGAFAISTILYFLIIKGLKGTSFISKQQLIWIEEHTALIMLYSFIVWSIILQLFIFLKINILKIIVLVGTFALAMAFAGNDLVNFIGVPLAGLASFKGYYAQDTIVAENFSMEMLKEPVNTPTYMLLLAGIVMVLSIWFSKKARSVIKTSVDLSRQSDGEERFQSSTLAKVIVRIGIFIGFVFSSLVPAKLKEKMSRRFDTTKSIQSPDMAFDLIRASVNLTVSSILIAFATSLKLPLSTTYVTFMVAMGASLSDRAWDRESAVYRVTGVITVIGGWFFTAFSAFTVAFILAMLFYWGGIYALVGILALALFILIRSHLFFKQKQIEKAEKTKALELKKTVTDKQVAESMRLQVNQSYKVLLKTYHNTLDGLIHEKRKQVRKCTRKMQQYNEILIENRSIILRMCKRYEGDSFLSLQHYITLLNFQRKLMTAFSGMIKAVFEHIDNNHKPLSNEQHTELKELNRLFDDLYNKCSQFFQTNDEILLQDTQMMMKKINELADSFLKKHLKQIRKTPSISTRNSLLYIDILTESKNLATNLIRLIQLLRESGTEGGRSEK